jgi:hypothetical protein
MTSRKRVFPTQPGGNVTEAYPEILSVQSLPSADRPQPVIGSVYPEKLTFDGDRLRTTRIIEAVRLIYTLDKELAQKEKGQSLNLETLSSQVGKTGFEPATPWSQTRCATGLRYFPNRGIWLAANGGQR